MEAKIRPPTSTTEATDEDLERVTTARVGIVLSLARLWSRPLPPPLNVNAPLTLLRLALRLARLALRGERAMVGAERNSLRVCPSGGRRSAMKCRENTGRAWSVVFDRELADGPRRLPDGFENWQLTGILGVACDSDPWTLVNDLDRAAVGHADPLREGCAILRRACIEAKALAAQGPDPQDRR